MSTLDPKRAGRGPPNDRAGPGGTIESFEELKVIARL